METVVVPASDPYGRIVAEVRSNEAPVTTLLAHAPIGSVPTRYRAIGDVFGWTSVALVAVLTIRRRLSD
jgi:apolipoprotein N-acyltransferase